MEELLNQYDILICLSVETTQGYSVNYRRLYLDDTLTKLVKDGSSKKSAANEDCEVAKLLDL